MRAITEQQKQEAIAAFAYEGTLIADTVYGSGHVHPYKGLRKTAPERTIL